MCRQVPSGLSAPRLLLMVTILMSIVLVSCGKPNGQEAAREVSFLYYAGVPLGQMMQEAFPAFTKQSGISVKYTELPYDAIRQREIASIQNNLGNYDVIFVDDIWMYEYARRGYLVPLDSFVRESGVEMSDFFDSARKAEAELDGKIWLMPQRADVQVLFYRVDLFESDEHKKAFRAKYKRDLAVPETWEEYRDVAQYFTNAYQGASKRLYGAGETLKRPHFAFEFFAMRYWSFTGEQFFSDTGTPAFTSPEGIEALKYLVSLAPIAAPGAANWAHDETISAFAEGELAMAPQWYDFYPTLRNPKASKVSASLGVAPVPGIRLADGSIRRTPSIGGGSLGIARDAKDRESAWELINYMTGKEFLAHAALLGAIVPRKSAYENPEVRRRNPAVDVYLASLEQAWFRPRLEDYARVEAIIGRGVSRAFVKEATPEVALSDAAAEVHSVLAK